MRNRSDHRSPLALSMLALAALSMLAACGGGGEAGAADAAGEAAPSVEDLGRRPASTLPLPGEGQADALPEGHPPLDPGSIPAPAPPAQGAGLHWEAPPSWVPVQPSSSMRQAQYRVPGPGGDAECIVYYFGPGQGGTPHDNASRWAGQFEQPDGRSSLELMKMRELEGAPMPVAIVEVTGTYDGGMTMTSAPSEKMPGAMLLGGIAQGPDAPWFFKLTGPEKTVRAQVPAFEKMMRSLHAAH